MKSLTSFSSVFLCIVLTLLRISRAVKAVVNYTDIQYDIRGPCQSIQITDFDDAYMKCNYLYKKRDINVIDLDENSVLVRTT